MYRSRSKSSRHVIALIWVRVLLGIGGGASIAAVFSADKRLRFGSGRISASEFVILARTVRVRFLDDFCAFDSAAARIPGVIRRLSF